MAAQLCPLIFIAIVFPYYIQPFSLHHSKTKRSPEVVTTVMAFAWDSIRIACVPPVNASIIRQLQQHQFSWTYHGKPDGQAGRVDPRTGDYVVDFVNPEIAGVYDCWVKGVDDHGVHVTSEFSHRLIVFTLPRIVLEEVYTYHVPKCVEKMDYDLIQSYRRRLCDGFPLPCPFSVSYRCFERDSLSLKSVQEFVVSLAIVPSTDFQPPMCSVNCIRKAVATHLYQLKLKTKNDWRDLLEEQDPNAERWYDYDPALDEQRVIESCEPGYTAYEGSVCIACEAGTFWYARSGLCELCPKNSYQDRALSTECVSCPPGQSTRGLGATTEQTCVSTALLVRMKDMVHGKEPYVWLGIAVVVIGGVAFLAILSYLIYLKCNEGPNQIMADRLADAERYERLTEEEGYSKDSVNTLSTVDFNVVE